ncbi:hypothetical protein [Comamonas thiooxydans]|uniref:hypothetical protein n=1 Tax=Comamonas thiooxydans TaxID=363952 RepID=UPI000B40B015|nr:hypothetical protein [Comamonas thiooxydans]
MKEHTVNSAVAAIQLSRLISAVLASQGYKAESKKMEPTAAQLLLVLSDPAMKQTQCAAVIQDYYHSFIALVSECFDADAFIRAYFKNIKPRQKISDAWFSGIISEKYFTVKRTSVYKFIQDHAVHPATRSLMRLTPKEDQTRTSLFSSVIRNNNWLPLLLELGFAPEKASTYAALLNKYTGSTQGFHELPKKLASLGVEITTPAAVPVKGSVEFDTFITVRRASLMEQPSVKKLMQANLEGEDHRIFTEVLAQALVPTPVSGTPKSTAARVIAAFNAKVDPLVKQIQKKLDEAAAKKAQELEANAVKALQSLPNDVRELLISNPELLKKV